MRAGDELLDVGDIDGDGQLDLLVREAGTDVLRIHRGGQPMLDPPIAEFATIDAAVTDVDDDDDLDIYSTQDGAVTTHFNVVCDPCAGPRPGGLEITTRSWAASLSPSLADTIVAHDPPRDEDSFARRTRP